MCRKIYCSVSVVNHAEIRFEVSLTKCYRNILALLRNYFDNIYKQSVSFKHNNYVVHLNICPFLR